MFISDHNFLAYDSVNSRYYGVCPTVMMDIRQNSSRYVLSQWCHVIILTTL